MVVLESVFCSRCWLCWFFFFQAEDGIRDLVRSRGLGDVYKRQGVDDVGEVFGGGQRCRVGVGRVLEEVAIGVQAQRLSLIHI